MFSLTLAAEGRPVQVFEFDQDEVTIGRAATSDIQLPTNNVSKQHARIVRREGKYFIVDRKSTNGSYVNGNRVTAPQALHEADKVYVGDFTLTFSLRPTTGAGQRPQPPAPRKSAAPQGPTVFMQAMSPEPGPVAIPSTPEIPPVPIPVPSRPMRGGETEPPGPALAPPPLPPAAWSASPPVESPRAAPPPPPPVPVPVAPPPPQPVALVAGGADAVFAAVWADDALLGDARARLARRTGDAALGQRVGAAIDTAIGRLMADADTATRSHTRATILSEVLGLGALETAVADDTLVEVLASPAGVRVRSAEGETRALPTTFSGPAAFEAIARRVAALAGVAEPGAFVDATLPDGRQFVAALPPAGIALRIVRRPEPESVEDIAERAGLNARQVQYLVDAVASAKNILVVGSNADARLSFVRALGGLTPKGESVVAIETSGPVVVPGHTPITFSARAGHGAPCPYGLLETAVRFAPSRIVVGDLRGDVAAALLLALTSGFRGAIASGFGFSAEDGLKRLEHALLTTRHGAQHPSARQWIADSFDLVLTVRQGEHGSSVESMAVVRGAGDRGFQIERVRFDE